MSLPPSYCLVKEYKLATQAVAEISGVGGGGDMIGSLLF